MLRGVGPATADVPALAKSERLCGVLLGWNSWRWQTLLLLPPVPVSNCRRRLDSSTPPSLLPSQPSLHPKLCPSHLVPVCDVIRAGIKIQLYLFLPSISSSLSLCVSQSDPSSLLCLIPTDTRWHPHTHTQISSYCVWQADLRPTGRVLFPSWIRHLLRIAQILPSYPGSCQSEADW